MQEVYWKKQPEKSRFCEPMFVENFCNFPSWHTPLYRDIWVYTTSTWIDFHTDCQQSLTTVSFDEHYHISYWNCKIKLKKKSCFHDENMSYSYTNGVHL